MKTNVGGIGGLGLRQKKKYEFNNDLEHEGILSVKEQRAWLARSSQWPTIQANNYVGKRVLGAGTYGIVGAWELRGKSATLPTIIVVKQVFGHNSMETLRVESKLLRDIMTSNTTHVVKLYKSFHKEGGSGSSTSKDPLPSFTENGNWTRDCRVGRIYMEYCPNGSLESSMKKVNGFLPEEYVWRVLHCLATALVVLSHGNEDPREEGPTWASSIVHFDIKAANILVGEHSTTHPRLPVHKLADFGLSLPLPREVLTRERWDSWSREKKEFWTTETTWRNTPGNTPPEQVTPEICDGRIGYRSDIWCIGTLLYELMTNMTFQRFTGNTNDSGTPKRLFDVNTFIAIDSNKQPYKTYGRDIIACPFSKRLIDLTHLCLAQDPEIRPTPRQVLRSVYHTLSEVYDHPTVKRDRDPKVWLHSRGAPRYQDPLLDEYTLEDIDAFDPITTTRVFQPQSDTEFWSVAQEQPVSQLPPFVAGPALDPKAWPWKDTIQPSGPTQGTWIERVRAFEYRAMEERNRGN